MRKRDNGLAERMLRRELANHRLALELLKKGCSLGDLTDRSLPVPSLQEWRKDHICFEDEEQTRFHKEFGEFKRSR